ncbi:DNA cytosine methyltransferase [Prochlorothrix hollandica]|uniref:DNA cytosine methyltransferase n=1 Tax=Prochlorothrix hollandica TaxID=1223 RepID=UPI003341DF02
MANFSCLELFAGAGGLATGLKLAGIHHRALIEWGKDACQTLTYNYGTKLVYPRDVREVDFKVFDAVDIIAAGPPCQPFSMGGKHQSHQDQRDMFPSVYNAISICYPKIFILENVKGLLRTSFKSYFEYILGRLRYPQVKIKDGDTFLDHLTKTQALDQCKNYDGVQYQIHYQLLDAADYGVPQRRERVFIVGIRKDLNLHWSFPQQTHSLHALLRSQYVSDQYWQIHQIEPVAFDLLEPRLQKKVAKMQQELPFSDSNIKPWKTVRDQIGELPLPDAQGSFHHEHTLREGAKSYPGHTGSFIDMPSKTLKAGDHGVPGGENMIRYGNGDVRYYTIFEAKLLQTFPADYQILGSWTEAMRQIGNAVPVTLGWQIAGSLLELLRQAEGN